MSLAWKVALGTALLATGLYFGVTRMKRSVERQLEETATRPYKSASGLVIASVPSDYSSEQSFDGSILLRKPPAGAGAGLAAFYRVEAMPAGTLEKAIASMRNVTYTPLQAPKEPCRSDAETSTTTLGELAFPERKVTLWTCTVTKKDHAYFLVWAASSEMLEEQRPRLQYILRTSQLVSGNLCAMNVINGGCSPNPSALVSAVVESARK